MAELFDQQTRHRVIAGRGGAFLRSTWSCVRQNFKFAVQSVCDAPIINTSYQKLPFGSGDYPDKLLFHQALNEVSNSIINTSYQKLPFGSGDYPDKVLFHQALH